MASTIFIPVTKWKFKEAVAKKLLSLGDVKDHGKYFWEVFSEVSGYTYDLDIHLALGRDLHQLQPPANDFEAAVREEFLRLVGETEQEEDLCKCEYRHLQQRRAPPAPAFSKNSFLWLFYGRPHQPQPSPCFFFRCSFLFLI